jgi:hypothetical protein
MPINPQIFTPQIQGIQLENPLNMAKNALAIREAQSQIAANQLKTSRAEQLRNIFAGKPGEQLDLQQKANALIQGGFPEEAKQLIDFTTSTSQSRKAALESEAAQFALLGSEAGAFVDDPASLNKASILPWASAAVQRGLLTPDALKRFEALQDDPRVLGAAMRRLQVQALTPVQQLETSVMEQDLGGESRVLRIPKLSGAAEEVVGSRERVTPSPNRPQTTVIDKGDTAEEVEKAKDRVKEYSTVRDRAVQGRRTLPSLQRAASALEKFETGFGAEATTEARRVLVSLGLADAEAAEKVKSADAFAVAVKDRILFKLSQQAGTQTEGDAQRAEDTWASYRKLTDSNKFLIDLEKAVIAQDNEQLKFYDDWEAENGTYRGAAQAWRDGPGSKSLFDRPEMKKYAEKNQGTPKPPDGFVINPPR